MEKSNIAGKSPRMVELKSGDTYAWCACGRSSNQPWCDGSHKLTTITPTVFVAEASETKALCMCKQTKNPPFCDGSHRGLGDG
jgi:CDGSH-type Zn-finger protein